MTPTIPQPCILVLTSTFPRWKDDTEPPFVFELCRRLAARGMKVHVLAPHTSGAALSELLDGVEVTRFRYFFARWESLAYQGGILANLKRRPLRHGLIPLFFAAQLWAVLKLLRRRRFACIHAHWLIPQGLVAMLARCLMPSAPPVLVTSHGGDLYGIEGRFMECLKNWIAHQAAAVTVVSRAMQADLAAWKIDPAKVCVIPMGVDLQQRFVPPLQRPNAQRLLFVGRLVEKKGLPILLEALARIVQGYPHINLRIVGDGSDKARMQQLAETLGIKKRVEFAGALANPALPRVYGDADILVFPSVVAADGDREGFGLVLVEALGCECAVVASDLPAVRDIVAAGETALMVPPRDVARLAAAIERLLADAPLRRALGQSGRRFVLQRYDWEIICRQYAELIASICGDRA